MFNLLADSLSHIEVQGAGELQVLQLAQLLFDACALCHVAVHGRVAQVESGE